MNGKENLPSSTSKGDIPLNNCGYCASVISYISQLEKRIPPPACAKCRLCNFHKIVSFLSEIILPCPPANERHEFSCPLIAPPSDNEGEKPQNHPTYYDELYIKFALLSIFPADFVSFESFLRSDSGIIDCIDASWQRKSRRKHPVGSFVFHKPHSAAFWFQFWFQWTRLFQSSSGSKPKVWTSSTSSEFARS